MHKTSEIGSKLVGLSTRYGPGRRANYEKSCIRRSAALHIVSLPPIRSQIQDASAPFRSTAGYEKWKRKRRKRETDKAARVGRLTSKVHNMGC